MRIVAVPSASRVTSGHELVSVSPLCIACSSTSSLASSSAPATTTSYLRGPRPRERESESESPDTVSTQGPCQLSSIGLTTDAYGCGMVVMVVVVVVVCVGCRVYTALAGVLYAMGQRHQGL